MLTDENVPVTEDVTVTEEQLSKRCKNFHREDDERAGGGGGEVMLHSCVKMFFDDFKKESEPRLAQTEAKLGRWSGFRNRRPDTWIYAAQRPRETWNHAAKNFTNACSGSHRLEKKKKKTISVSPVWRHVLTRKLAPSGTEMALVQSRVIDRVR